MVVRSLPWSGLDACWESPFHTAENEPTRSFSLGGALPGNTFTVCWPTTICPLELVNTGSSVIVFRSPPIGSHGTQIS